MTLYLRDDKLLVVGGQLAASEDCCCQPQAACCYPDRCLMRHDTRYALPQGSSEDDCPEPVAVEGWTIDSVSCAIGDYQLPGSGEFIDRVIFSVSYIKAFPPPPGDEQNCVSEENGDGTAGDPAVWAAVQETLENNPDLVWAGSPIGTGQPANAFLQAECVDGVAQAVCEAGLGKWQEGTSCADNPCVPHCCIPNDCVHYRIAEWEIPGDITDACPAPPDVEGWLMFTSSCSYNPDFDVSFLVANYVFSSRQISDTVQFYQDGSCGPENLGAIDAAFSAAVEAAAPGGGSLLEIRQAEPSFIQKECRQGVGEEGCMAKEPYSEDDSYVDYVVSGEVRLGTSCAVCDCGGTCDEGNPCPPSCTCVEGECVPDGCCLDFDGNPAGPLTVAECLQLNDVYWSEGEPCPANPLP